MDFSSFTSRESKLLRIAVDFGKYIVELRPRRRIGTQDVQIMRCEICLVLFRFCSSFCTK